MSDGDDRLRAELASSFANRAMLYWHMFDEMRGTIGEEAAVETLGRATYRRGVEVAKVAFRGFAPTDARGVARAFLSVSPDRGRLFPTDVTERDDGTVEIQVLRCPLLDAWQAAGLPERDVETLCVIAGRFDNGLFETAGVGFESRTWRPGGLGCCRLTLRPRPASEPSGPASADTP